MNDPHLPNSHSSRPERPASNGAKALNGANGAELVPYREGAMAGASDAAWAAPASEVAAKPSGLRGVWDLLSRRRKIVLPIFLLVLALGLINSWSKRRVYQATATLLANTAPLGGEKKAQNDPLADGDVEGVNQGRSLQTQMEILRTSAVIRGAFAKLTPEEQKSLQSFYNLDIANTRDTDLITVAATSYDPQASASLANAVCQSYIESSQENNRREVGGTARFVKGQLETVNVQLKQARDQFRDFQQQNNITDVAIQSTTVNGTLNQIKNDLRQAQSDLSSRQAQLQQLEGAIGGISRELLSQTTGANATNVVLRSKLTDLQIQRSTALATYLPTSTKVQDIDGQIARIKAQLAAQPRTEDTGIQRAPNPAYTSMREQIETARADVTSLGARVVNLQSSLTGARADLTRLPAKTARFGQLSNTVTRLEETAATLDQKYRALKINEEARLANASLTSPANPPGGPQSSERAKSLALTLALALALAYATALLLDQFDDKVHSPVQAETAGRLPMLLDVPFIKDAKQQCILTADSSILLESFEMLTAQIALAGNPVKSVLMTSSLPGEGKSVSSVNLAIAAALSGQRVILVDCDLRQSTLHRFFKVPVGRGFSDAVSGRCSAQEATIATRIPGLSLMTGGSPTKQPLELLRSRATHDLLADLMENYDLVVIDSPPALLIADATVLAAMADATLMVVSCNEAKRQEIGRATNLMWQTGAHLMGLVLTKVPAGLSSNYSYSGYYSESAVPELELGDPGNLGNDGDNDNNHNPDSPNSPDSLEVGKVFGNGSSPAIARNNTRNKRVK